MTTWNRAPLGELTRVVGGTTPSTSDPANFGGEVGWVTPIDLGRLQTPMISGSARTITSAARSKAGIELLPPGTVVMSSRAPIGYLGIAGVQLCTNQGCKSFVPGPRVDSWFLYYTLRWLMPEIRTLGAGATFAEVSKNALERFEISFPELAEQQRIAAGLSNQLAEIARTSRLVLDTTRVARQLGLAFVSNAFHDASRGWPTRSLGEVAQSLRSPSTSTDGDTEVVTVTSGSLTPFGFSFDGLGSARMSAADALDGIITADEVLVARSNTEPLVGRASKYPGGPSPVVASDLIFRLRPDPSALTSDYLAGYLAVLQLDGYWRDRSSGASSTMKKITKELLSKVGVPIPPLQEQRRVTEDLRTRQATTRGLDVALRGQGEAIGALPRALLRQAFAGYAD
jgi:Restriction endonuclease S subunits